MTYIRREVYIVNDFRVNLLLDTNAMMSKNIMINYLKRQISITNCEDFIIDISISFINSRVNRFLFICSGLSSVCSLEL